MAHGQEPDTLLPSPLAPHHPNLARNRASASSLNHHRQIQIPTPSPRHALASLHHVRLLQRLRSSFSLRLPPPAHPLRHRPNHQLLLSCHRLPAKLDPSSGHDYCGTSSLLAPHAPPSKALRHRLRPPRQHSSLASHCHYPLPPPSTSITPLLLSPSFIPSPPLQSATSSLYRVATATIASFVLRLPSIHHPVARV